MSKITLVALYAAIALIALAMYFNVLFFAKSSGAVLVIALVYSYVVSRREVESETLQTTQG